MCVPLFLGICLSLIPCRRTILIIALFGDFCNGRINLLVQDEHIGACPVDIRCTVGMIVGNDMGLNMGPRDKIWLAN